MFLSIIIAISQIVMPADTNWRVGSTADYQIDGGFISGTMHAFVREEVPQGFWVRQDIDLGFAGRRNAEMLYDKRTGKMLELIIDGERQEPPDPADIRVIASRPETITVPRGTFACAYLKTRNVRKNEDLETWTNPAVPVGGLVKTNTPTPIGQMTIELTAFVN